MPAIDKAAESIDKPFVKRRRGAGGWKRMLIPTPRMLADALRGIPRGQHGDLATIRKQMAADNDADGTCPVTIRRHLKAIAAEAHAQMESGWPAERVTPFWRAISVDAASAKQLAGGVAFIRARQREELT